MKPAECEGCQSAETIPVTISNCRKHIGFGPYHSPLMNGVDPANKSYIHGAVFENTGLLNLPFEDAYASDFISLWKVHGVGISGNKFYGPSGANQITGILCTVERYTSPPQLSAVAPVTDESMFTSPRYRSTPINAVSKLSLNLIVSESGTTMGMGEW